MQTIDLPASALFLCLVTIIYNYRFSDKQDCYCSLSSKTLAALLHKKVIQE